MPAFDQRLQHFEWVLHQYRDGNCDRDAVDESRSAVFRATPAAPSVPPLPDDTIAAALADPACTRLREWAAWCSWFAMNAREAGRGTQYSKKKCEKGEALKGAKCGTCDGSGIVTADIRHATHPQEDRPHG